MIRKHKKTLILSSLLTLLPILVGLILWDRFPEQLVTHWGVDGQPDGWSSVPFAVFFPPLILLAAQWLCVLVTAKDPGNKDRNRKPQALVLWIIPVVSNLCCGMMYALTLGADISVNSIMVAAMGLMFIAIGNYLPKCRMNSTIGIKIPWTYTSEENWNATHRFAGKVWVIGGLVIALSALIPGQFGVWALIAAMFVLVIVPMVYSRKYYNNQVRRGDALNPLPKMGRGGWIALVLTLVLVIAVLFAGHIDFVFREDYLMIDTNMYSDHIVYYDVIESIEYREGNVSGSRVGGFGSLRLLMGYFENEEFGIYTRYTYTKPEVCLVLTLKNSTLVLCGKTADETREIYEELLLRIK